MKPETVEQLANWLLHEANLGGRYLGDEAKEWKIDVARRIRAAVRREQAGIFEPDKGGR